jgi:hypothetical protein
MGESIAIVELERVSVERCGSRAVRVTGTLQECSPTEKDKGCRITRALWPVGRAPDLGLAQLHGKRTACALDYLVLRVEQVSEFFVKTVGPEMHAIAGGNQLDVDTHTAHALLYTTLKHVAHPEVPAQFPDVGHFSL